MLIVKKTGLKDLTHSLQGTLFSLKMYKDYNAFFSVLQSKSLNLKTCLPAALKSVVFYAVEMRFIVYKILSTLYKYF